MSMMTSKYFYGGYSVTLLFKQWQTSNIAQLILSCIALLILSAVCEALKVVMERLSIYIKQTTPRLCYVPHCVLTFLYLLQMLIRYLLMLAFMTRNCWICTAIIFGSALGYFFSSPHISSCRTGTYVVTATEAL